MIVHESKYLVVTKQQDDTLLLQWANTPLTSDDFTQELLLLLPILKKIAPKQILWNNEEVSLTIPPKLFEWIKKEVLPLANKTNLNDITAISTLTKNSNKENYYPSNGIQLSVQPHTNNVKLIIDVDYQQLPDTLSAIESFKRDKEFAYEKQLKFKKLTVKEIEVFRLLVHGNTNKEVATLLFIETTTVATHRKRIIKKLELHSFIDWFKYAKAFKLINI